MKKYIFLKDKQIIAYTNNEFEDFGDGKIKGFELSLFDKDKISLKYDIEVDKDGNISYIEGNEFLKYQEYIKQNENQEKINLIELEFQKSIQNLISGYSQAEIDSWERKIEEAKKVIAGETSTFISTLCLEGEDPQILASKILEKADAFSIAYATAEKIKREKLQTINS